MIHGALAESTGSSVVIEGNQILTCVYGVSYASKSRSKNKSKMRDAMRAYGYRRGGNSLSITKSVVSRAHLVRYSFSDEEVELFKRCY